MSLYANISSQTPIAPGLGQFSRRARFAGLGEEPMLTQDAPASYYCKSWIAEVDRLKAALQESQTGCSTALSSAQASCGAAQSAAAYGMAMERKRLNDQIAALQAALNDANAKQAAASKSLSVCNANLASAVSKVCPAPPTKSCLFWIVTTVVASGVAAVAVTKGNKDKKKDKKEDKAKSLTAGSK
jgi:hypothetical protein